MAGVNDLSRGASVADVVDGSARLCAALGAAVPGARLVLQSLLPVASRLLAWPTRNVDIAAVNRALPAVAAAVGAAWLDAAAAVADARGELDERHTGDGVHLSPAGYRAWAAAVAGELVRLGL
jgi:lysophospholipase L1-like esterase